MRITLGNRYDSGTSPTFSNQSVNVSWDWVLVRKFLANEPGVTVSNVEVAIP
jgi:hypothetical protein